MKRVREGLNNYFLPGFFILFVSALIASLLSFFNNLFATLMNPLFGLIGAGSVLTIPGAVYFAIIILASLVGFFIKIPTVQRFIWRIPVISLPFKIAFWVKIALRFPFVRLEGLDGNRTLAIVTAIEVKRAHTLNANGELVPARNKTFELAIFVPSFPVPAGGYWIWAEPRRVEYILNSKSEVFARALSAGLSIHTKEGDPELKTVKLGTLSLKQLQDLLKLSEIRISDIDIGAGESQ